MAMRFALTLDSNAAVAFEGSCKKHYKASGSFCVSVGCLTIAAWRCHYETIDMAMRGRAHADRGSRSMNGHAGALHDARVPCVPWRLPAHGEHAVERQCTDHLRVHGGEARCVLGAVVGRHPEAQQEDAGAGRLAAADDLAQIVVGLLDGQAAQTVVAAKGDHHHVRMLIEEPAEAREAAGRGVAADAGVDHADGQALLLELLAEERRIGLVLVQPETGREAVAQEDDDGKLLRQLRGWSGR